MFVAEGRLKGAEKQKFRQSSCHLTAPGLGNRRGFFFFWQKTKLALWIMLCSRISARSYESCENYPFLMQVNHPPGVNVVSTLIYPYARSHLLHASIHLKACQFEGTTVPGFVNTHGLSHLCSVYVF